MTGRRGTPLGALLVVAGTALFGTVGAPIVAGLLTRQVTRTWCVATAVSVLGLVLLVGGDAGGLTEPVVAAGLGVLVLGERLGPAGAAGAVGAVGAGLVLVGLFVLVTRSGTEQ